MSQWSLNRELCDTLLKNLIVSTCHLSPTALTSAAGSIISHSCPTLRNIYHLWFAQGRAACRVPAGSSLTSHSLQPVLASYLVIGQQGLAPGALDPPPGEGREAGGTEEGQTKTQPGIPTANSPPTVSQHLGHSTQPLFLF